MGVEDKVGRLAIVAPDKSRREGIEEVLTTVSGPSTSRGSPGGAGNPQTKDEAECLVL